LLEGIASNCRVQGDNPAVVGEAGLVNPDAIVEFDIACDWNGRLTVTITTTGANYDPAGLYTLYTPWNPFSPFVGVNYSWIFGPILAGDFELRLAVPTNCLVGGDNPRTVAVIHNQAVETIFAVVCS
jgi:hypothetical protein